jgi:UPF0755 protein
MMSVTVSDNEDIERVEVSDVGDDADVYDEVGSADATEAPESRGVLASAGALTASKRQSKRVAVPVETEIGWDDDDSFVTVRPAGLRFLRGLVAIALILLAGWWLYGVASGWFAAQLDPEGEPGEVVDLVVPVGATTADIARQLESENIIPNSTFFRYFAQWKGEGNFGAGEYFLQQNSSAEEAIAVLNLGPTPQEYQRFTIREGLWIEEMLPEIASQLDNVTESELRAVLGSGQIVPRYRPPDSQSWEGLFFPDTYEVNVDDTALDVLLRMSDQFTAVTGDLGFGAAETQLNRSAYEVLVVASLVEAEAKFDEERPLVASVIYNRLREQWALGIDATCIYGAGDRRVQLTNEILQAPDNPFGCRNVIGLPPTPIGAPGRASLEAAINPAETEFMYYVLTDASGLHTFATTDEEFAEAKAICVEKGLC